MIILYFVLSCLLSFVLGGLCIGILITKYYDDNFFVFPLFRKEY